MTARIPTRTSLSLWPSPTPIRRFQGIGRICLVPFHIARWSVDRRDVLTRQAQPGLDLGPMVAGMEDTPPEGPDSLPPQPTEERHLGQPPLVGRLGKLRQPLLRQRDVTVLVGSDRWLIAWREQLFDGWLLDADELGEEPTLREDLVDEDGTDRVDLLVELEVQQIVRDRPRHAGGLVGLGGVGDDEVLEQRVSCLRNVVVRDGDEVVVHESSLLNRMSVMSATQTVPAPGRRPSAAPPGSVSARAFGTPPPGAG